MMFEKLLAGRTENMKTSAIRELLKVTDRPGMISLGGGLPSPLSFPVDMLKELSSIVLDKHSAHALQYGASEGYPPLRQALSGYLKKKGIKASADEILITSGSQGFLDCIAKILVSEGDCIAVEAPTYLGAIQAFNAYEPRYICMATDDDGLIPESLDQVLRDNPVKFVYLIPTFQNPTGRTIPFTRRKQIAEIIQKRNILLVEDDPYSALRYRGKDEPAIHTLAPDHVVYISTFSKILAPGFRVGFCFAPELIRKWLVLAKQGVDLHTSTFTQALAAEYIEGGYLEKHLPRIIDIYKPKQETMLHALDRHFPNNFHWSKPDGGMFIWVNGPKGVDMTKIYPKAIERNMAFVPGTFFFTQDGDGLETMRLNFTNSDENSIDQAIKILADVINDNDDI